MEDNFETKFKKCEKELLKVNHDLDMLYEKYDTKTSELKQRIRDLEANNKSNNNENLRSWVERFETLHEQHEELKQKHSNLVKKYNKDIADQYNDYKDVTEKYNNLVTESYNREVKLIDDYNKLIEWTKMAQKELIKCGYTIVNPAPAPIPTTNTKPNPNLATSTTSRPTTTTNNNTNKKCEGAECTIMGGNRTRRTNKYKKSRKQKKMKSFMNTKSIQTKL